MENHKRVTRYEFSIFGIWIDIRPYDWETFGWTFKIYKDYDVVFNGNRFDNLAEAEAEAYKEALKFLAEKTVEFSNFYSGKQIFDLIVSNDKLPIPAFTQNKLDEIKKEFETSKDTIKKLSDKLFNCIKAKYN